MAVKTLEQAENWLQDTDEIEIQFMHIINLSIILGEEWLNKALERMYASVLTEWDYKDMLVFESRGMARSMLNNDQYLNTLMRQRGLKGEKVGLGYGA